MPRSVPHCGSVRFMVPVHSPDAIFGRYFCLISSEALASMPWKAPLVRPGYMEKAAEAAAVNWPTAIDTIVGRPWPPYSVLKPRLGQPASTIC
ncbi:hypothetical protein D9M72_645380 [compost metagenome]